MAWDGRVLRAEVEALFGAMAIDDRCPCNRTDGCSIHLVREEFVSTENDIGDDAYGGHLLYAPPWREQIGDRLVDVAGPQTLGAYAEAVAKYDARGFWRDENSAPRDLLGSSRPKKRTNDNDLNALKALETRLLPLLSPAEKTIFDLRYQQGLTWGEIARKLGRSPSTARVQDRAIKRKAAKLHD